MHTVMSRAHRFWPQSTPVTRLARTAVPLASGLALLLSGAALANVPLPALVSGPSPYAGCTAGAVPGATVYPNAEVEPFLDVNPTTVGSQAVNLVGVWQQDAWSDGAARGGVAGYSSDGGTTWGETPLPFSVCAPNPVLDPTTGAPYDRVADDWISFGPDGVAYTSAIAASTATLNNGVVVATSVDGGGSWRNATVVQSDAATASGPTHFLNDKDAITADPTRPGTAYVVWDRRESPDGFPLFTRGPAYRGPTLLSQTNDGGRTWSAPKIIVDAAQNSQTLGNQIVVAPDGALYNFFALWNFFPLHLPISSGQSIQLQSVNVAFVKSTDHGGTWTAPQMIADVHTVGVTDPNTGAPVTTGAGTVAPAVDPVTGALYVVWEDARFSGGQYDEIALSTSVDGGAHWTAPARLNTPTSRPAFNPAIRVAADGTVGITYYDFRSLAPGNTTTLPTGYWLKKSPRGGSFSADIAIVPADQPFNLLAAPSVRGGLFVGDYEGLAVVGSVFRPFFVRTICAESSCVGGSNPTDVYTGGF
jgi:hypothetical protein